MIKKIKKHFGIFFAVATAAFLLPAGVVHAVEITAKADSSKGPQFSKVDYKKVDSSKLVKPYPFLKDFIEGAKDPDEQYPFPPNAFISETGNFLFLYLGKSNYCGPLGCALHVYDKDNGYKEVLDIMVFEPMYISQDKKALVFCTKATERTEWDLKDNYFVYKSIFKSNNPPPCR